MYKKGHKHSEETKRKIGEANRGNKRPDLAEYNKTRTDLKGRTPWNKGLTGIDTGPPKGTKPWNTGKKWSEEVKRKISESRKGKGTKPESEKGETYKELRNGWRLQEWADKVRERDGKCTACGATENLEAHHILPKKAFPKKMYDVDNGVTLCRKCHKQTDTYGNKNLD